MANKIDVAREKLVEKLRAVHGENLASIVLYGSVAAGDHLESRSDHNLLIVLNRITPEDLLLSLSATRDWVSLGQPMPIYFAAEDLKSAADVFPIEFLQMEQARKILHGSDPFEFVEISQTNLRHQTEYELRTKMIQLQRLYLRAHGSADKLTALLCDSLASFAALFRAVLIMHDHEPPADKADSVRATAKLLGLDAGPFERIFELRAKSGTTLTAAEANIVFSAYVAQIEKVIKAVDQYKKTGVPRD